MTHAAARTRASVPVRALLAVIALALFGIAMLCGTAPASAHAVLVASTPVDGSEVAASPARVTLTFDEPVQLVPGTARVLSATGARADAGGAAVTPAGTTIIIPLRADLGRGSYTATWRVVSADTHIVAGSITFGVRQAATAGASTASPTIGPLDVAVQTGVGLGYVGVILLFGVLCAFRLLWPHAPPRRRGRALMRAGWLLLAIGALLQLLLEGPRAAGSGWLGVVRGDGLGETLASASGRLLLLRLLLLAVVAGAVRPPAGRVRSWLVSVLAVGVLVTIGAVGHADTGPDAALAIVAAVLHLASMAVWLGAIVVLFTTVLPGIRTHADVMAARLERWSRVAFVSVAVLVVSGEYQAWRQIQPPPALWSTSYGITLLVKLALVALALAGALVGQRLVIRMRRAAAGSETGSGAVSEAALIRRLRRSVRWEAAAVVAVLVTTTVLTALPPATATYGPPTEATAPLGSSQQLVADFDTTHHGPVGITVTAEGADGAPIAVHGLTATLSSTQNGVSAIAVRMRREGHQWHSVDAVIPLAGTWTMQFDVGLGTSTGYATSVSVQMW